MTKDMKMDGVRVRARVSVCVWVCGYLRRPDDHINHRCHRCRCIRS